MWYWYVFFSIGPICTKHPLLHPFKYRQRKVLHAIRCYQTTIGPTTKTNPRLSIASQKFQFRKVLIVTKLSRYEFEQHKNPKLSALQLEKVLRDRGTDYDLWLQYHQIHKDFESKVADSFRESGINVKLVNR